MLKYFGVPTVINDQQFSDLLEVGLLVFFLVLWFRWFSVSLNGESHWCYYYFEFMVYG